MHIKTDLQLWEKKSTNQENWKCFCNYKQIVDMQTKYILYILEALFSTKYQQITWSFTCYINSKVGIFYIFGLRTSSGALSPKPIHLGLSATDLVKMQIWSKYVVLFFFLKA